MLGGCGCSPLILVPTAENPGFCHRPPEIFDPAQFVPLLLHLRSSISKHKLDAYHAEHIRQGEAMGHR
jgi:hypothetical protein